MIAVTVFEPNGISIWFKNRHHDLIPFTVKGNGNIVFSVYSQKQQRSDVQLSERLASLGIMGAQLRAPLKPPVHHSTIILRK